MQAYPDRLSSVRTEPYKLYVQTFMVDIWRERGLKEFRFGSGLRRDSRLHTRAFKIGAQGGADGSRAHCGHRRDVCRDRGSYRRNNFGDHVRTELGRSLTQRSRYPGVSVSFTRRIAGLSRAICTAYALLSLLGCRGLHGNRFDCRRLVGFRNPNSCGGTFGALVASPP